MGGSFSGVRMGGRSFAATRMGGHQLGHVGRARHISAHHSGPSHGLRRGPSFQRAALNRDFRMKAHGVKQNWPMKDHGLKVHRPGKFAHFKKHHKHRRKILIAAVYPYYDYYYGYYDECDWLYRKALRTGDPYWWDRYRQCLAY
jgi:hypothetical protein